ncbi:MAG: SIR2 family protein [Lachnospiraceae bacterium]|nr:SIR2 family protein [Ruminococcus sp.]MCM1276536.1 SIR2 family protein [Lachnospiraceae bacterium]
MKRFDCENLFCQALKEGITFFCGAGFSVLSYDRNNSPLPVGDQLLDELKEKYNYINSYSNLSRACTKISKNDKRSFYDFLEERFCVSFYDDLYNSLDKINLKSVFTTNIDDLFYKIFENSKNRKKLYARSNGEDNINSLIVDYYALHGSIREKGEYLFGVTDIASAFSRPGEKTSWKKLATDSSKNPILFWGWNFNDPGPIEAMYGKETSFEKNVQRWVLLYNPDEEMIDFLESLRFNIIIGDTKEMLNYIDEKISETSEEFQNIVNEASISQLKQYSVPKNDIKLPKYPIKSFFLEYAPQWSHIYSGAVPKTKYYTKLIDRISSGKDIILIGIRCSGKTTLLMQACVFGKFNRPVHFMSAPSLPEIELYINLIGNANTLLFVDNCFRDTNAVCKLLETKNIQVILSDRDFNFERQFHKISQYMSYIAKIDVTELDQIDAQNIVDAIPVEIKKNNINMSNFTKDPTLLNLLANAMKITDFKFIEQFAKQDKDAARVFMVVCYVHSCGVPCSFDMIYSFLGNELYTWQEMYNIIERIGGLIKDLSNGEISIDYDQDYFICRSRILAEKIISSIPEGSEFFKEVLNDFTEYVPQYKICQYDKFRRYAYDSMLVSKAYKDDLCGGGEFYEICSEKDDSEYIFQQAALYFSRYKDYVSAFYWIDKARNISHYNRFSIDSTYAQIYFDANFESESEPQLIEALNILKMCCTSDKRKNIHYVAYAKRAIQYFEKFQGTESKDFLLSSDKIISEALLQNNQALGQKNRWQLLDLQKEIDNLKNKFK